MLFYNAAELNNHIRKFCTQTGLNSLEGLAQYDMQSKYKRMNNLGAQGERSLKSMNYAANTASYEPNFSAGEIAK